MALDEAKSSYDPAIVQEVRGESDEHLEKGLQLVEDFLNDYKE